MKHRVLYFKVTLYVKCCIKKLEQPIRTMKIKLRLFKI